MIHTLNFRIETHWLDHAEHITVERAKRQLANAITKAYEAELKSLGVQGSVTTVSAEKIDRVVGKNPALAAGYQEPGLPLRQFVRGFLRDHLGMSKIVAHMLADLFMKRWLTRTQDGTAERYAELEDEHTRAATADRRFLKTLAG